MLSIPKRYQDPSVNAWEVDRVFHSKRLPIRQDCMIFHNHSSSDAPESRDAAVNSRRHSADITHALKGLNPKPSDGRLFAVHELASWQGLEFCQV